MAVAAKRGWQVAAVLAMLFVSATAASKSKNKQMAPAGKQLFHEGENALSWDSDILAETERLHKRDFSDKAAFLRSAHLAQHLGLHSIGAMHMPVPLSIVLVGFGADGNGRVNISESELRGWLGQLDHVLPHTRVALSELSCQEDGHCSALLQSELRPSPLRSYVHLNFSCEVVLLQRNAVLNAFERAIFAFSRPEQPLDARSLHQVDALKMEAFIEHFVQSLGLGSSYVLLVVNPKWTPSRPKYGYRAGFSQWELDVMQQHVTKLARLSHSVRPEPQLAAAWPGLHLGSWQMGMPLRKFASHDATSISEQWARQVDSYLEQEEDHRRGLLRLVGEVEGAPALAKALQMLKRPDSDMAQLLERAVFDPTWHITASRLKFRTAHPLEDCLVHSWVGHGRWLYVDLTAGGFDWGPALGGEGVVTPASLPSPGEYFSTLQALRDKARAKKSRTEVDAALEQLLARLRHSRISDIAHKHAHAASLESDILAPGESIESKRAAHERKVQELQLKAELDIVEDFAMKHCHNKVSPPPVCADMQRSLGLLQQTLAALSTSSQSILPAFRDHLWDIFGTEEDVDTDDDVVGEAVRSRDLFMAELTAVLSRGVRHVIAPPTATWHHNGYLHDTATPYAAHVTFSIYEITEERHVVAHSILHTDKDPHTDRFDVATFKTELQRLQLHAQTFKFHSRQMNLLEDPAVAVAFASSLKASFAEVPDADANPQDHEQVFIDSKELAHRLRKLLPPKQQQQQQQQEDWHAQLDVPVFIFNLRRQVPVLVDEHYSAKALEDMVLVLHNSAHMDAHPTGMMCNGALLARPISPLKDALAAVLQHLGGVLPPHLGYHPDRHAVTHDWLWSVGAHPFSHTSSGHKYTQLQIDALHRSYLLDAVDSSVDLVNQGMEVLQGVKAEEAVYEHLVKNKGLAQALLKRYHSIVESWRTFMASARDLDFSSVAAKIAGLEKSSKAFLEQCEQLAAQMRHHSCTARAGLAQGTIRVLVIGSTVVASLGLMYAITPAFRKKPKFN